MCFMFVNVQARIYHKETNNQAKTENTGTRVGKGQKVKARDSKLNISPSCIQDWQNKSLEFTLQKWHFQPLKFRQITLVVLVIILLHINRIHKH